MDAKIKLILPIIIVISADYFRIADGNSDIYSTHKSINRDVTVENSQYQEDRAIKPTWSFEYNPTRNNNHQLEGSSEHPSWSILSQNNDINYTSTSLNNNDNDVLNYVTKQRQNSRTESQIPWRQAAYPSKINNNFQDQDLKTTDKNQANFDDNNNGSKSSLITIPVSAHTNSEQDHQLVTKQQTTNAFYPINHQIPTQSWQQPIASDTKNSHSSINDIIRNGFGQDQLNQVHMQQASSLYPSLINKQHSKRAGQRIPSTKRTRSLSNALQNHKLVNAINSFEPTVTLNPVARVYFDDNIDENAYANNHDIQVDSSYPSYIQPASIRYNLIDPNPLKPDYSTPFIHQQQTDHQYQPSSILNQAQYLTQDQQLPINAKHKYANSHHSNKIVILDDQSSQSIPSPLESATPVFAASKLSHQYHYQPLAIHYATPYPVGDYSHGLDHGEKLIMSNRKSEKSLKKPIIVGIVAGLISFLVISNVFLAIPLLAMTLLQLFNNQMLIPPNSNNNNGYRQPNNNNNNNNNQSAATFYRRDKRYVRDHEFTYEDLVHRALDEVHRAKVLDRIFR